MIKGIYMMNIRFILLSFLTFCVGLQGVAQQRILSLDSCIARALESNYSIKIVKNRGDQKANDHNISPFLPQVDLTLSQRQNVNDGKIKDASGTAGRKAVSTNALNGGIGLKWRLFDGLGMFSVYSKTKELFEMGDLQTKSAIEQLIVKVSTLYYDVIMSKSKVDAARHSMALSAARYAEAHDKYVLGVLSGLEAQQAVLDMNADSSDYIRQKELLNRAYISLNMVMNTDLDLRSYVSDSIRLGDALDYGTLLDNMLAMNTELQIAEKNRHLSRYDMKMIKASYYPKLDFDAGYNSALSKDLGKGLTNTLYGPYYGFSVKMDIFDGLERRNRMKNAEIDVENADLSYNEIELEMKAQLAQLFNTYENNLKMVEFEKESVRVAYENLDAALEKYKLEELAGIEFREFQRSYIDAVDRQVAALYRTKVSELSLMLMSGRIIMPY